MAQDGLAYSWTTTQPISVYELPARALRVEGASNQTAPDTKIRNMNGTLRSIDVRLRPFGQVGSTSCHVAEETSGAVCAGSNPAGGAHPELRKQPSCLPGRG
jgi:hypothetical protein